MIFIIYSIAITHKGKSFSDIRYYKITILFICILVSIYSIEIIYFLCNKVNNCQWTEIVNCEEDIDVYEIAEPLFDSYTLKEFGWILLKNDKNTIKIEKISKGKVVQEFILGEGKEFHKFGSFSVPMFPIELDMIDKFSKNLNDEILHQKELMDFKY